MSRSGKRRVVVTGMSTITSIGHDWQTFEANLRAGNTGVKLMPDWQEFEGLNTNLAAPVTDFKKPAHYPRKKVRGMGRVSLMSTVATEKALEQAGLLDDDILTSGYAGVAYGSSTGSTDPIIGFGRLLESKQIAGSGVNATSYIQMMSHTAPVNVALFFGFKRPLNSNQQCLHIRQSGYWHGL